MALSERAGEVIYKSIMVTILVAYIALLILLARADERTIPREIERERQSMAKCGRPGTSDLFPDLRPCDYK